MVTALVALLALLPAALSCACSASAAPVLLSDQYQLASREALALAGAATLATGYQVGHGEVVRSLTEGQSPVVLARLPREEGPPGELVIAGSPTRIALLDESESEGYKGSDYQRFQRVLSAPLGASLHEATAGCPLAPSLDESVRERAEVPAHSAVALDGEVLAYDSYGCVMAQDAASGLQRTIPLEASLDPVLESSREVDRLRGGRLLRVAGRLIAFRANAPGGGEPAAVVVYGIDSGSVLYRVPLPALPLPGFYGEAPTFALQADGTLVIADEKSCTATVSTTADPSPQPLGIPVCEVDGVSGGRALVVVPGPGQDRSLAWTPLQSPLAHPIADIGDAGALQASAPVIAEEDVAYALESCTTPHIYRAALAEPGSPPAPPTACPVIVSRSDATLALKSLSVRIRCPLGCEGEPAARAGTPQQLRHKRGEMSLKALEAPDVSIAPGGSATVTFRPSENPYLDLEEEGLRELATLKRILSSQHRLDLRLEFNILTPTGQGEGGDPDANYAITGQTHPHFLVPIHLKPRRRR